MGGALAYPNQSTPALACPLMTRRCRVTCQVVSSLDVRMRPLPAAEACTSLTAKSEASRSRQGTTSPTASLSGCNETGTFPDKVWIREGSLWPDRDAEGSAFTRSSA